MYIYSARPELISSEYVRKLSGFLRNDEPDQTEVVRTKYRFLDVIVIKIHSQLFIYVSKCISQKMFEL